MTKKPTKKNVAPIRLELLITVVDKKKADFFADLISGSRQAYFRS